MKATEAMRLLKGAADPKGRTPILGCVYVRGGMARATDLKVGATVPVEVLGLAPEGEGTVPVAALEGYVKRGGGPVGWTQDGRVNLGADTFYALPLADAPALPAPAGEFTPAPGLREAFDVCLPATTADDARYSLNAVQWTAAGRVAASDGCRLHVTTAAPAPADALLVPMALVRILPKRCELEACAGDGHVWFRVGSGVVLDGRLCDGNFPRAEKVIPRDNAERITLHDAKALAAVCREFERAARHPAAQFTSNGEVTLTLTHPEIGVMRRTLDADGPGRGTFGVRPKYFAEAVAAVGTPAVLAWKDESDAVRFDGPRGTAVVMPMRLT